MDMVTITRAQYEADIREARREAYALGYQYGAMVWDGVDPGEAVSRGAADEWIADPEGRP